MLNIDFYKKFKYFKEKNLLKWEIIFDEWDLDNNLYIITSWSISIQKYTTIDKVDTKELAILKAWDFFWEASLNNLERKEVKVISLEPTTLLCINWELWVQSFIQKSPKEWLLLLNHIIDITNKRLLKANRQITANFEIVKSIQEIEKINEKNIFILINKIKSIIWCDYILFFERNTVLRNYINFRYDTRKENIIQEQFFDLTNISFELKDITWIELDKYNHIEKLNIWELELWFLVFWNKKMKFNENDQKLISSISSSLTWVLKQREILKEENNKNYIKQF